MQKITKKALSLVLCVMLVVSAISCAFNVIAEGATNTRPKNLDFSDGFNHWIGETYIYSAENGVLKTNSYYDAGSWRWLKTEPFNIPNAVEGTTVELSFDVAFEDGLPSMNGNENQQGALDSAEGYKILDTYLADASITDVMDRIYSSLEEDHELRDLVSRNEVFYNEEGKVTLGPITVTYPTQEFDFWISCGNSSKKTWEVTNITVTVTHPDGTVEVYPSETDDEQPEVPVVNPNPPKNLDFSNGFNYWNGETYIYSAENGVLKTNSYYDAGSWRWLKTEPFNIPNAVEGTTVELSFDVAFEDGLPSMNGNENQQGTLNSAEGYKILDTYLADASITDVMDRIYSSLEEDHELRDLVSRNEVFYNEEGKVTLGPITVTDPTQEFDFWISCGNSSKKTWEVTNITVTVTHPDGTVETYHESVPDDEEDENTIPSYYGTEEKGFTSAGASWPNALKPADDIYNLDFSKGFIYWSGRNAGLYPDFTSTYASDSFKLVTEGDNKYITMRSNGYVDSMRSALFNASNYVAIGDELALVYDAKGADADKIRVTLQQDHLRGPQYVNYDSTTGLNTTPHNASPGIPNILVNNEAELTAISVADGWTTYVTSITGAVNDPTLVSDTKVCLPDIFLQIIIKNGKGIEIGDQLDVAIDNIRIAKIQDGVYTDILTGDVLYTDLLYGKVAQIGDEYFETVEAAIAAAQENDTIKLIADVVIDETIKVTADKKITLDLNGFVIDGTEKVRIALMTYGDVTLKDSSAKQTGIIRAGIGTAGNAVNVCGGTFTMESGRIYSKNNALLIDEEACTVNINGGYIAADPVASNSAVMYVSSTSATLINITAGYLIGDNGILLWNNTELNITGGTIDASSGVGIQGNGSKDNTKINISGGSISGFEAAIYHPQGGELNISGTVTLTGSTGIVVKGGKVTVSGGKIIATGDAVAYEPKGSGFVGTGDALYVEHYDNSSNSENYGTPVVSVTGGVFNSANANAIGSYANTNNNVEALTGFVTGGTFDTVIDDACLAEGFALKDNAFGAFTVVKEYDLETGLYCVKGFKPAGSDETRYGFLMTIGIDSLNYNKDGCGFYLTVGNTTKKFVIANGTVWESLTVDLPTETVQLAPVDFGEGNQYIMHYTVYFTEAELEALGNEKVSVKGFVTTFEGEELVTKTFNCGTLA